MTAKLTAKAEVRHPSRNIIIKKKGYKEIGHEHENEQKHTSPDARDVTLRKIQRYSVLLVEWLVCVKMMKKTTKHLRKVRTGHVQKDVGASNIKCTCVHNVHTHT